MEASEKDLFCRQKGMLGADGSQADSNGVTTQRDHTRIPVNAAEASLCVHATTQLKGPSYFCARRNNMTQTDVVT